MLRIATLSSILPARHAEMDLHLSTIPVITVRMGTIVLRMDARSVQLHAKHAMLVQDSQCVFPASRH